MSDSVRPHGRQPTRLPCPWDSHWSGLPFPSPMHESEKWKWSHSVVSDSQWSHGLHHAILPFHYLRSLLKLMSIESVMPCSHLILCFLLLLLPSIFHSIRVFSNESVLQIRWPKFWSFSFSISPSNEYSGLISFSIDWFDLLTVQGTLKSLLQHQKHQFFNAQLFL